MPKHNDLFDTDGVRSLMDNLKVTASVHKVNTPFYHLGTQSELLFKMHKIRMCEGDWLIYDYHGLNFNQGEWCLFAINKTFTIINSPLKFKRNSKMDNRYGFITGRSIRKILNSYTDTENIDLAQGIDLFKVEGLVNQGCYRTNHKIYTCETSDGQIYGFFIVPSNNNFLTMI